MNNTAELRKAGKLIAKIEGAREPVKKFVSETIKLYKLQKAESSNCMELYKNGDVELEFITFLI